MQYIAFAGTRRIASGGLEYVARAVKAALDRDQDLFPLIFDAATSQPMELDLRGSEADVVRRLPAAPARGPGRPKLGVVAREITLLPRHWEWLNAQPGGASVALRKLVEAARRTTGGRERVRTAQNAAYRFMAALAGNETGYDEAARALFASDRAGFAARTETWPPDIRAHLATLADSAFEITSP